MTQFLSIDFETHSVLDVRRCGAFRYAEDPTTGIWVMSYRLGDGPVKRWHPGMDEPDEIWGHVFEGGLIRAWNAQFEECIWNGILVPRFGWNRPESEQWVCTAAIAARAALPRNLEDCAKVLHVEVQKDMEGNKLMKKYAKPRKARKGEDPSKIYWYDDPADLERIYQYCDNDVLAESAVFDVLPAVGDPAERRLWLLDQEINRRGVAIDRQFVDASLSITDQAIAHINDEMNRVTDGAVPKVTNVARLRAWVNEQGVRVPVVSEFLDSLEVEYEDAEVQSLDKEHIRDLLKLDLPDNVSQAIRLRAAGNKSSTAKLTAMNNSVCADGRIRGMLLYHGASTGRWAGRLVQPQNFPRGSVKKVERYHDLIRTADYDLLDACADDPVMDIMATSLRGCFVSGPGKEFVVADFNAIEARVLAWLAGAQKLLKAFREPKSLIYSEMGAAIFGLSVADVQSGHDSGTNVLPRWVGKNAILGCGYQMGWKKFKAQCKKQGDVDLDDETAESAIKAYRAMHFEVPDLWKSLNMTAIHVVQNNIQDWVPVDATDGKIHFGMDGSWLRMLLPSGRSLWYANARIIQREAPWSVQARAEAEEKGLEQPEPEYLPAVGFSGVDPKTKQWRRQALYGGLLTENAVQAISRDLMREAMFRLEEAYYPVVLTVHDEIVTEPREGHGSVEEFCRIMSEVPEWAEGCPIAAEGWRGKRYRK